MSTLSLVDFHTHILPKMDDGADSSQTSIAMLERLEAQGVTDVVLTPHYYSQREPIDVFLARRESSYRRLCDVYNGPIQLHLCAEIYYSEYLFNNDDLSSLCLPGSDLILLELPYNKVVDDRFMDQIWRVSSEFNVTPMLAHIERYSSILKSNRTIEKLVQLGCLLQLNVNSFERRFGRKRLISLVEQGVIDAIGTDCHNVGNRPPEYMVGFDILKKSVSEERLNALQQSMHRLLG